RLVRCSFDDSQVLDAELPGTDVVMHFAASSIIQFAFERPVEYFHNNVTRGVSLLEGMRRHGVPRIVFSSTASVYGEPTRVPIDEEDPKQPAQAYGASKLAFEAVLSAYYYAYGIHSTAFRYFNAYGPNDEQQPATRAVPRWIKAALRGEPLTLFWGGRQLRDYVFVEDIVAAHLLAMRAEGCRRYNLGSGTGVLMIDLAREILAATNSRSEIVDAGERPGDPSQLVASTARVQAELGWKPAWSRSAALEKTIAFYAGRH
ncbi:MAG: UDP-glucose 4-epimerase, partial [Chloroflexi bacterium]|nr:UDP-glucose 4-epimerase [Chloroflexota bacterium]